MFDAAGEIAKADSPGFVPIRALVYGLLDDTIAVSVKHNKLVMECALRAVRALFSAVAAPADAAPVVDAPPAVAAATGDKTTLFRDLVEAMSGERIADFIRAEPVSAVSCSYNLRKFTFVHFVVVVVVVFCRDI